MSEDPSVKIVGVDLGKLAKPIDTLIKKVSDATGAVFELVTIATRARQKARAQEIEAIGEAKANLILTESSIEISDLERRAIQSFVKEEAKQHGNMEDIFSKALSLLEESADASRIEDDWMANFFDKCRIVSDDEMQVLWSKVLSGEVNTPGTYSKRTVNNLSDLEKAEAQMFTNLCQFNWRFGGSTEPTVFDLRGNIYNDNGVDFNVVNHLDSIGLISLNIALGYRKKGFPPSCTVSYHGQTLELAFGKEPDNELESGFVMLTKVGRELVPICGSNPVDGFFDYMKDIWKDHIAKQC